MTTQNIRLLAAATLATLAAPALAEVQIGPRPMFLADALPEGDLKAKLQACEGPFEKTDFSIGHRGAPLMFPEHTVESNMAAARMGAGILECDVAFTADKELDYMDGTAGWRTDLYATTGTLMTHAESIALFKDLGAKFTPELKYPSVEMPFDGFTQEDYAQKLVDEYKAAGVPASDVFAQSFNLDDVLYWIKAEPEFGKQAVFLVEWYDGFDEQDASTWKWGLADLKAQGVNYLAPSINMMITEENGEISASAFAKAAKEADLKLIAWTLERSGPLATGGGWYYKSVTPAITNDSDYLVVLDVLAQDVGVEGVFSDWPATVTYYANCMGL
eukprot:g18170.t1